MVIVVKEELVADATKALEDAGEKVHRVGRLVTKKDEEVILSNFEHWDRS
jgi:homoserine kinase